MSRYVKTDTILDRILAHKVEELQAETIALATIRAEAEAASPAPDFAKALRHDHVALIAEVKRASPSKGVFLHEFDPVAIARTYADNGASAISVLTDEKFFQGHLDYLAQINQAVTIPTLRKDFIIDPYQIYAAKRAGASAVLLIVAALADTQLADLHALVQSLGMTALVEIHNQAELDRALKIDATVLGINNRDLKTFAVDLKTTARIAARVPDHVTLVAESGLKSVTDVARMGTLGAHAVLIGEGLVTSGNMALTVREFANQKRG
jgi:indole-3-glycerol phosphate synthase